MPIADTVPTSGDPAWIVDQIVEGLAALEIEDGRIIHLPTDVLPAGLHEGDVLRVRSSHRGPRARIEFEMDEEETASRRRALDERTRKLAATDPGGDLTL